MKKIDILDKKTLLRLEHEVKQKTAEMCKNELEEYVNDFIDQCLADPGNPLLCAKASIAAKVWKGRYPRVEESL